MGLQCHRRSSECDVYMEMSCFTPPGNFMRLVHGPINVVNNIRQYIHPKIVRPQSYNPFFFGIFSRSSRGNRALVWARLQARNQMLAARNACVGLECTGRFVNEKRILRTGNWVVVPLAIGFGTERVWINRSRWSRSNSLICRMFEPSNRCPRWLYKL